MFDPNIHSANNRKRAGKQRMINFQGLLDLNDLVAVTALTLPATDCDDVEESRLEYVKDVYLQLDLINIGNKKIDSVAHDRLRVLKAQGKGVATAFFKVIR
jgi:archaellum biogenesis ATPase FlaH